MKHKQEESGINFGSCSCFQRKGLLAFRKILTCLMILAWEREGRNVTVRSLYFQWCPTEFLAAPWYEISAELEHELCGHSVHPFKVERQEATFVNSVWEETLPDSNGLSALPIKNSVQNKLQSTKFREGYPLHRREEETGRIRTNVKFPFPLKLFFCWCSLQPLVGTATQNQSLFHILLRQGHCSLLDFEKPPFKITAREKSHDVIYPS